MNTDAPSGLLTLPPLPKTIGTLTNVQSRSLNARIPMAAVTPANCITCHGRKTFRWLDAIGQPADYACPCEDQYVLFRWLLNSGIPLAYQRLGWTDLTYLSEGAIREAMDYLDHQQAYLSAGFGMVIHGTKGNGKSLLSMLILKRLIEAGVSVYATTFADMLNHFMGTWRDKDQERWFNQIVRNAGVLYIDDIGREYQPDRFADAALSAEQKQKRSDNRPGAVRESMLEAVIRHRVANCQPTFITTNFSVEEIQTGYGGHTMSLLGEKAVFVEATGIDRRQEMNRREIDYAKQGLTRPVVLS